MKSIARKTLCIAMVLLLAISANGSAIAGAHSGIASGSAAFDYWDNMSSWDYEDNSNWDDYIYYDFVITTGDAVCETTIETTWACPDEEEYYLTYGRLRDLSLYLNHAEYEGFRASGMKLSEFLAMRESGLWFCVILNEWICPEEHGLVFLWDIPFSDEVWPQDSEALHAWPEDGTALASEVWGETTWACPDEEHYFITHGRYRNPLDYIDLQDYEAFTTSGMSLEDFITSQGTAASTRGLESNITLDGALYVEDGGSTDIRDIPYSNEIWPDEDATEPWDSVDGAWIWACPDEKEYYITHGRLRDLANYLSPTEYEVFRATGMRLAEFLALRQSGMGLYEIAAMANPHMAFDIGLGPQEYYGEIFYFYDLPIVYDEEWPDDEAILFNYDNFYPTYHSYYSNYPNGSYQSIMPLSVPVLTVTRGTITSNSVFLTGRITSTGGTTITARGFWIRRDNQTNQREVLVNTSNLTFSTTITGLMPNSTYHIRAIARAQGIQGSHISGPDSFRTLSNVTVPGAPQGLRATPAVGQVTLTWSAPSNNGGATITRYEVALNNGGWTQANSMAAHTFTNLASGTHTFRVRAVNSAGAGTQASTQASPTAAIAPVLTASRGTLTSTSVTLNGTITNTGGAAITARGFWIRPSGVTPHQEFIVHTSANSFSHTITGLIPGTTYLARSFARNSAIQGSGISTELVFTTPATVPSAPLSLRTTSGVGQVTLSWSAPSNNGGATITRYEVALNSGGWTQASSMSSHTFTNLASGTHTFRVRAVNSAGAGTQANIQASPTAVIAPVLTISRGTTTSTSVALTGTITNTGGAAITARGFWIRPSSVTPHQEIIVNTTANSFTHTIPGLVPGTTYIVRSFARNSVIQGSGISSEIIFTTPATVPGVPLSLRTTPGVGQVTLNWSAPTSNGGAAITRYEVALNSGTWVSVGNTTSHTFTGLPSGTHTFRVRAVNSVGAGAQASITASSSAATLTLNHSRWDPSNAANNLSVTVTSNASWTVSSNATSWLTVTPASGTGNGSFTIRVTANTGAPRSGRITVSATGATPRTVDVSQGAQNFTVTFNPSGGVVSPTSRVVASGAPIGTLPVPTRAGHTFAGWFDSPGGVVPFSADVDFDADFDLDFFDDVFMDEYNTDNYVYSGVDYTFYDTDIRENEIDENLIDENVIEENDVSDMQLIEAASAATQITASTIVRGNMTIFARWNATVTFNANGGTVGEGSRNVVTGNPVGTLPVPTRGGYTFAGWFTAQTGGTQVTPITIVTGNVTYWARWSTPTTVNLTFIANSGTPASQVLTRTPGATIGTMPTVPVRENVIFAGWFDTPEATGGTRFTTASTVPNVNTTYWARWSVAITLDPGWGVIDQTRIYRIVGAPIGELPTPRREGQSLGRAFLGWRNLAGHTITPNTIVQVGHLTQLIYARWGINTDFARHLPFWYWSNNINIRVDIDPTLDFTFWDTAMDRGRINWNRSNAPVNFNVTQSTNNIVSAEPIDERDALGWLMPEGNFSGRQLHTIEIYLNSRFIFQEYNRWLNNYFTLSELITLIMSHELGHAIGLEDDPPFDSIMCGDSALRGIRLPTNHDIESVRMIYD